MSATEDLRAKIMQLEECSCTSASFDRLTDSELKCVRAPWAIWEVVSQAECKRTRLDTIVLRDRPSAGSGIRVAHMLACAAPNLQCAAIAA